MVEIHHVWLVQLCHRECIRAEMLGKQATSQQSSTVVTEGIRTSAVRWVLITEESHAVFGT